MNAKFSVPALSRTVATLAAVTVFGSATSASDYYQQRNLVSDGFVAAENTDDNLVNPWGVTFNPYGFVWVADNEKSVSTLYDGSGKPQTLVVKIPPAPHASSPAKPTGIVYSGAPSAFMVTENGTSGPARFIFATEDGTIAGWAPNVDMTNAIGVVDNSASGAMYKGLALSAGGKGNLLYAADFHNGKVDVFDSGFKPVPLSSDAFTDPNLPGGYAPFGIQAINGDVYVAYARQNAQKDEEIAGKGLGYIDVYAPNGKLLKRVVSQGELNAPWGMVLAPAGFGKFSNRLLVGNFGDGVINAYALASGEYVGRLEGTDGQPLRNEGLWGLAFGNGYQGQPVNALFFAAGPEEEEHGVYGRIDVAE